MPQRAEPDMPAVEVVASVGDLCGECPLWLPREQALLWTDITGRRTHRWQPADGSVTELQHGTEMAGLLPHAGGGYVLVNSDGVHHWDGAGVYAPMPVQAGSHRLQLNDCIADRRGRLLTGSAFYVHGEAYPLGSLFSINLDGAVRVLLEGLHLSNGLAFSPDGTVLYVTDSIARRIYAGTYDQQTGDAVDWRVLVQVSDAEGIPDGLAVDAASQLWSAQWYGGCVVRYGADGRELGRIHLPVPQVSSVAFGGPTLRDLYITSAARPEAGPVPPGYVPRDPAGGDLYRVRLKTPGQIESEVRIPLPPAVRHR